MRGAKRSFYPEPYSRTVSFYEAVGALFTRLNAGGKDETRADTHAQDASHGKTLAAARPRYHKQQRDRVVRVSCAAHNRAHARAR